MIYAELQLINLLLNFQQIHDGKVIILDLSTGRSNFIQSKIWLKSIAFNLGFVF